MIRPGRARLVGYARWLTAAALAAAALLAVAVVLLTADLCRLHRLARQARALDLSPIALTISVADVTALPAAEGNAAEHYLRALDLLADEAPRVQALLRQLDETGVTAETDLDLACLEPLAAGAALGRCRFTDHLPHSEGELAAERGRLAGMLTLGRLVAALSRREALSGRPAEAEAAARRLLVLGWHLMQPAGLQPLARLAGPPNGPRRANPMFETPGEGTGPAGVDARIAGLTLVRWGAHALAPLLADRGEPASAAAAKDLEADATRTGDALAVRRERLRDLFAQARVAREDPDTGFRVLAVIRMGARIASAPRPLLFGRQQYDATCRLLARLADDADPEVRAAARLALEGRR